MKLKDRLALAVKAFTLSNSTNSNTGTVLRNYAKPASFRPTEQLMGITYKAVEKISLAVASYEPKVIRKNGDVYENHPFYNLFNKPNPRQNATDFLTLWSFFYEIYGETFIYTARGEKTNKIKELYLLNPAQMELVISYGELLGYKFHKANGSEVPFTLEEVIHDKRPNPFNEWRGMSVMERASTYIDTELVTSTFTLNYMKNNASPSGIVSLPNMTKESFNMFAQQWRENYEGPENAGKTAFVRGEGTDFKAVGATLKDVDQEITRKMSKEDVLMMFDVPKGLLGVADTKGLGVSDLEPLEYIFAKYNTEPRMKRLDRIFETMLQDDPQQVKDISHVSPIPDDKKFALETNKAGVNVWLTVNEVREQQGLPPLPDGDVLNTGNTVAPAPTGKKIVLKKKVEKDLKAEQEAFRNRLVKINETYEVKIKRAISRFSGTQEYKVIESINASSKSFEEWLFNIKEESEALAELINPIMIALVEEQAKHTKNFISGEVFKMTPEMREAVTKQILQVVGVYEADTLKALEKTIGEGMSAGESLVKIKHRVEDVYSDAKGYRAERIARSESLRTSNSTAEEVYRQNGYTSVEWYVNPGACEFCQSMAGVSKSIGGSFLGLGSVVNGSDGGQLEVSYSDIETPPLHPNCTCSLIPSYN